MTTIELLQIAKASASALATLSTEKKNAALRAMADALENEAEEILDANREDLYEARNTMSEVMLDRLRLDERRLHAMAEGIREVAKLPDPVGKTDREILRPNGLHIRRVRVPMGVVAIIYESRPNVTSDAAALCLKSGNVCVLRGGKEAYRSVAAIVRAMRLGLIAEGLPEAWISVPEDTSRASAKALMEAVGLVDLLIPRGGAGLIRACVENARVPCIQTGTGICHIYVDRDADPKMALRIIENAKASRPSVCNAAEVCLVDREIAPTFLPQLLRALTTDRTARGVHPVTLLPDAEAAKILGLPVSPPESFDTEFLDYQLAVGIVQNVQEAVAHIAKHSTHHSEAILTENTDTAAFFTANVDSAAVYVNASTRFTDGGEFGLGCEIGISTQKLHARGPMGLEELTSYKYIVTGNGQIR